MDAVPTCERIESLCERSEALSIMSLGYYNNLSMANWVGGRNTGVRLYTGIAVSVLLAGSKS